MRKHLNLTQFDWLEAQADHILTLYYEERGFPCHPPVLVEMIAHELFGLRCEYRKLGSLGNKTVGALSVTDGVIYVDERCNRHQCLFTVAHEIGHHVLHEGHHCYCLHFGDKIQIPLTQVLRSARATVKSETKRLREIEANQFAGALLIPSSLLLREAAKYPVIDAEAMGELARVFHVSLETMLCRLEDLSDYLAWSGPLIDLQALVRLKGRGAEPPHSKHSSTRPVALTLPLDYEIMTATATRASETRRTRSSKSLEAIRVFDSLIRFSRRHHPADLLSPSSAVSPEACARKRGDDDSFSKSKLKKDEMRRKHHLRAAGRKALIVEFAGTSNAGKDTQIEILKDYLEDIEGLNVKVIEEPVITRRVGRGLSHETIAWSVSCVVDSLHQYRLVNPGNYDVVIMNRGLFDTLALVHAACLHETISEQDEEAFARYLLPYAGYVDMVFLFLISPSEALRREYEGKRRFVAELARHYGQELPPQSLLNEEMLRLLNSSYVHTYDSYKRSFHGIYPLGLPSAGCPDISGDRQSIMERALGLTALLLPDSLQLPIPELFDDCFVHANSQHKPFYALSRSLPTSNMRSQMDNHSFVQLSLFETQHQVSEQLCPADGAVENQVPQTEVVSGACAQKLSQQASFLAASVQQ